MRIAVFSTKPYDRASLAAANARHGHELVFLEPRLTPETAPLAHGFPAVCAFVNDPLSAPVLRRLAEGGTRLLAHDPRPRAEVEALGARYVPLEEALRGIAETTLAGVGAFERGETERIEGLVARPFQAALNDRVWA